VVSPNGLHVADALCRAATEVMQAQTAHDAQEAIVRTAVRTVPGVERASISMHDREGGFATTAATDDVARRADQARYGHGSSDATRSARLPEPWPSLRAPDACVGAATTVLLTTSRRTATALNLYAPQVDQLDREARHIAHLFAAHARIGLRTARTAQDLRQALASRKEIGTAIGIVMERYQMGEDRAFDYLVRVSRNSNVKLREVAGSIVAAADRAHGAHGMPVDPVRPRTPAGPGPGGAGCHEPPSATVGLSW
jgi:hypothetical protein